MCKRKMVLKLLLLGGSDGSVEVRSSCEGGLEETIVSASVSDNDGVGMGMQMFSKERCELYHSDII